MVTTADMVTFQRQKRQEKPSVVQRLRIERNETMNGRLDLMISMSTAIQTLSASSHSDVSPVNWDGDNARG